MLLRTLVAATLAAGVACAAPPKHVVLMLIDELGTGDRLNAAIRGWR